MPYSSGYSVDLYCDIEGSYLSQCHGSGDHPTAPATFYDEKPNIVWKRIKRSGWHVSRDKQRVLCPFHAKEK